VGGAEDARRPPRKLPHGRWRARCVAGTVRRTPSGLRSGATQMTVSRVASCWPAVSCSRRVQGRRDAPLRVSMIPPRIRRR
jgi:hypothetical protein